MSGPKQKVLSIILVIGRLVAGGIFLYSGFTKLIQPSEYFQIVINLYRVFPLGLVPTLSAVTPWIEVVGGIYLLLGYRLVLSGGMLILLTGSFQILLAQALIRRLPIDECGCFGGSLIHLTLKQSFALDTVLLACIILIVTSKKAPFSLDEHIKKATPSSGVAF